MARLKLDMTTPARLDPKTKARLDAMSDQEIEEIAFDPDHAPSADDELDAAVAVRRLRELRRQRGMTQPEFSLQLHVPVGTIRDWEQGRRLPDAAAVALITVFENEPEAFERAFRNATARKNAP